MYQQYPQQYPVPDSSGSTWKVIKIGCGIMLAFFVLSIFGFYLLCNTFMEKSEEYENTLTELTGVFHSDQLIKAPLSGDSAIAVRLEFDVTNFVGGKSSFSHDDYDVLLFDGNVRFLCGSKSYCIAGTRPFRTKCRINYSEQIKFECTGRGDTPPEIPESLYGLDSKTDKRIDDFRNRDCGFGVDKSRVTVREYQYSTADSVTIKALVRNDTIFLYQ